MSLPLCWLMFIPLMLFNVDARLKSDIIVQLGIIKLNVYLIAARKNITMICDV